MTLPLMLNGAIVRKGLSNFFKQSFEEIVMNTQSEIAKIAYELWLKGDCTHGRDFEHWIAAEKIVCQVQDVPQDVPKKGRPKLPAKPAKKPLGKKTS